MSVASSFSRTARSSFFVTSPPEPAATRYRCSRAHLVATTFGGPQCRGCEVRGRFADRAQYRLPGSPIVHAGRPSGYALFGFLDFETRLSACWAKVDHLCFGVRPRPRLGVRCAGPRPQQRRDPCGMIGRFVQSPRAASSNRTAGAVETGGFRPPNCTLDWDEPSIVGPCPLD